MGEVISDSWWKLFDCFRQANADFSIFGRSFKSFFPDMFSFRHSDALERTQYEPSHSSSSNASGAGGKYHSHLGSEVVYDMKLAALAIRARRLVTTKTGYLGLVPADTAIGDTIAVIYGCNFPVVLRPLDGAFLVVGECCIPGIMEGEVIDGIKRREYEAVDISLR